MKKKLSLLVLTIITIQVFAFSQKAYEAIYYSGKTQNINVKFTFAAEYIGASEIMTTDNKTKKTSKFLPENGYTGHEKQMKFNHYSTSGKTLKDYFILEGIGEDFEGVPTKFYGKYYYNGTAYSILLTKL